MDSFNPYVRAEGILCNFASRADFVDWTNGTDVNIALAIESCKAICPLFYGTGNPDISGVGVTISYITQGVLTWLSGPVLGSIKPLAWVFGLRYGHTTPKFVKEGIEVHALLTTTNIFFGFSIVVATWIRLQENLSLFEINYLRVLNRFQANIAQISAVTSLCFAGKALYFPLVAYVVFSAATGFSAKLGDISASGLDVYERVVQGCADIWGFQNIKLSRNVDVSEAVRSSLRTLMTYFGVSVGIYIVVFLIFISSLILRRVRYNRRTVLDLLMSGLPYVRRPTVGLIWIVVLVFTGLIMVEHIWELEHFRQVMQTAEGSEYSTSDNRWDFGQITAVMTFMPVLSAFVQALARSKQPSANF